MAGLLGGLFGVGGGFLVIPLLGFFYGMDQQTAQGTVLIMVVPNVVWAFSRYRRRFGVDLRMAATIAWWVLIGIRRPVWRPVSTRMSYGSPSLSFSPPLRRPSPTARGAAVRGLQQGRREPGGG